MPRLGMSLARGWCAIAWTVQKPALRRERSTRNHEAVEEPYPCTSTTGVSRT